MQQIAPGAPPEPGAPDPGEVSAGPHLPHRFFGTVEINPDRACRDMGQMPEEVLHHRTTLPDGKVKVTVEIEAGVPKVCPMTCSA